MPKVSIAVQYATHQQSYDDWSKRITITYQSGPFQKPLAAKHLLMFCNTPKATKTSGSLGLASAARWKSSVTCRPQCWRWTMADFVWSVRPLSWRWLFVLRLERQASYSNSGGGSIPSKRACQQASTGATGSQRGSVGNPVIVSMKSESSRWQFWLPGTPRDFRSMSANSASAGHVGC
jgi:hypothetical protein